MTCSNTIPTASQGEHRLIGYGFTKETIMPLIRVSLIEGVFTETQKREMIHKLTEAMISIEGENLRPVTWVVVEEIKSGDWGIGGKSLTVADVKALAAGKSTG